jgi:xylulokinase
MSDSRLFLGLDSSTQGLKATVIDESLSVVYEAAINFDRDLPEYGTEDGAHRQSDGATVTSPTLMWVEALDLLLAQMQSEGWPLFDIAAISGSGQQHGCVWMGSAARAVLPTLDPGTHLCSQLEGVLTIKDSPIWMDSSTGKQCAELEAKLGGAQAVADLTGSRAYERFTGNQIAKIAQAKPAVYESTDRIALVSSFIASLLIGDYASIDTSDASGMNLMDVRKRRWDDRALDATAPGLADRLGEVVPGHAVAGLLHMYYVERYGFSPRCKVITFSGDNPNSLAGLRVQEPGDIAVSLGTSDTLFASLREPQPSGVEGHIFANPIVPEAYMAMICRQNGSLAREHVRDASTDGSWETFGERVGETPVGNSGKIGFYILEPEITPPIKRPGIYRFDQGAAVDAFSAAEEARAILEGQFLSMRIHAESIGIEPSRLIATGGASVNPCVLNVLANVFGKPVYVAERSDSASLGAAYRALHGFRCDEQGAFVSFTDVMTSAPSFAKAADPDPAAHEVYTGMCAAFAELEGQVAADEA